MIDHNLNTVMAAYFQQHNRPLPATEGKPKIRTGRTKLYYRSPLVVAIAKVRANHKCEVPTCTNHLFIGTDGRPYCETHHIIQLSQGGTDEIENVVCLCPAHHREAHYGKNAQKLLDLLLKIRSNPLKNLPAQIN